jgi:hypothetical protein
MKSVYHQLEATDCRYADSLRKILMINRTGDKQKKNKELYITDIFDSSETVNYDYYKFYDYIFWLNNTGKAIAQITPFSVKEKLVSYAERDYFKKKSEWQWQFPEYGKVKRFRMESIVSSTSGEYKVAFSKPSESGPSAIVMSGRFYSLIDPIIPYGYKFCIIDDTGKVWFHSNKYQNLSENFISECNDDKQLKAACYANVARLMYVSYYNHKQRIYLTPIKGLPLFMVTMYEMRYEYSYQAQVFITTLVLICFLFIFILLEIFFIQVLKHLFIHDLVTKKLQLDIIALRKSRNKDYQHLIFYFFFILVSYCILMPWINGIAAIIIIYCIVAGGFALLFYHLFDFRDDSWPKILYKIINGILITCFFLFLHFLAGNFKIANWKDILLSSIPLIICLAIIFFYKKNKDLFKVFIIRDLIGWLNSRKLIDKLETKPDINYSFLIFLMVILFSVAPILKFFDIAADLENNIHTRFGQHKLASSKENRNDGFVKYYERINNSDTSKSINELIEKRRGEGVFSEFWNNTNWQKDFKKDSVKEIEEFAYMVNTFRPIYKDEFSVFSKYLLEDSVQNRSFKWLNFEDSLRFIYNSPTENKSIAITSSVPKANIFNPFWKRIKDDKNDNESHFGLLKDILVYLILIFILFLILRLILFTTRRTFGLALLEDNTVSDFKSRVADHIDKNLPVLVVNPSAFLGFKELSDNVSEDFKIIDFNWDYPKPSFSGETYLVKDLFKDYQDQESFFNKMKIIMDYLKISGKLIILSEINPEVILNYYREKIETIKKPDPKSENKPIKYPKNLNNTFELLNDFMNRGIVLFVPVIYPKYIFTPGMCNISVLSLEEKVKDPEVVIELELGASDYLFTLRNEMQKYHKFLEFRDLKLFEQKQHIISRISEMAGKYYRCLLDTCSMEEKFVLIDLAFDSIANAKNKPAIVRLLRRGLLIKGDDSLELMNNSFRLFLLKNYSKQDKEQYRKSIGIGPGNWAGSKIAIFVVIAALFVFIFLSNQEFLQNLNKMFITLGASITGIISLIGVLGRKTHNT